MKFIKKWLPCLLLYVCGILGFALLPCSGIILKITIFKKSTLSYLYAKDIFKKIEVTKNTPQNLINSFTWLKIIAILCVILYVLLIIFAIVVALKNLKVIKTNKNRGLLCSISLFALLLLVIALLVSTKITAGYYALAYESSAKLLFAKASGSVGLYQQIMLYVAISANILNSLTFIKKKNSP